MANWIFKISNQAFYPDVLGKEYVYDNTHSVKVKKGDSFLYLDKRNNDYAFSAMGTVSKVSHRNPTLEEAKRTSKVKTVFTAYLENVIWLNEPLSISPIKTRGKLNRAILGIVDANLMGWSQSMPRLSSSMFNSIVGLIENKKLAPIESYDSDDYTIEDSWSKTKKRCRLSKFTETVKIRHNFTCAVCGTKFRSVLEAAHLSPYSTDKKNRANPANGICLCVFCHHALDSRIIAIYPDGNILVSSEITDEIALEHFHKLSPEKRSQMLKGIGSHFLMMTVKFSLEFLSCNVICLSERDILKT